MANHAALQQLFAARGLALQTADALLQSQSKEQPAAASQDTTSLASQGDVAARPASMKIPPVAATPNFLPLPVGLHEWFFEPDPAAGTGSGWPASRPTTVKHEKHWDPPLLMLAAIAAGLLRRAPGRKIFWIGRHCWPTLQILQPFFDSPETTPRCKRRGLALPFLEAHIFLDPATPADRLWAIEQSLHCPAIAVVIAAAAIVDAPAAGRRLQLAAEAGGTWGLLARPPWECHLPSWAATRWVVRPEPTAQAAPCWTIACVRDKGLPPAVSRHWRARWNANQEVYHDTNPLHLSAVVGNPVVPALPARTVAPLRAGRPRHQSA